MQRVIVLIVLTAIAGCSQPSGDPRSVAKAEGREQHSGDTRKRPVREDVGKSPASDSMRPENPEWRMSNPGNLQIAGWLDQTRPIIWCVIRNPSSSPLQYNDYSLGYFESVDVLARRKGDSDWTMLDYRQRLRPLHSVYLNNRKMLQAGEEVPPKASFQLGESTIPPSGYSFSVFLPDFQWPEHCSGDVEVIVRQHDVQMDDGAREREIAPLETSPVKVNVEFVRATTLIGFD